MHQLIRLPDKIVRRLAVYRNTTNRNGCLLRRQHLQHIIMLCSRQEDRLEVMIAIGTLVCHIQAEVDLCVWKRNHLKNSGFRISDSGSVCVLECWSVGVLECW